MSVEYDNLPEITALIGASLALCISDIPFDGPVGAVNVGLVNGEIIINPTSDQRLVSDLNLTVAGTQEAILMVEAGANEVSEDVMIKAILQAHESIKQIVAFQNDIIKEIGKAKKDIPYYKPAEEIEQAMFGEASALLSEAVKERTKRCVTKRSIR
jgi:polyribonucleotide nucleotidyltransferase